jgi:mono/diheme cytochrome c family protein
MNTNRRPRRRPLRFGALAVLLAMAVATSGCPPQVNSGVGFQLPQGDADRGKQTFVALKCHACHQVDGVDLPKPTATEAIVMLGGEVTQTRTYGRLMTAIIHPTQSLSPKFAGAAAKPPLKSPMPTFNDTMTLAQLVDLITFLQPHYRELQPIYEPTLMP